MTVVEKILSLIEEARVAKALTNDQARVASVGLALEGDEAMLACRLIAQGSDPASLDYIDTGEVSAKVALAHKEGPGVFKADDPDRLDYLSLCALSADESQDTGGVRGRFYGFMHAMEILGMDERWRENVMEGLGRLELKKIMSLPYVTNQVNGVVMRIYTTDRGFAAAVWDEKDPQLVAAVLGHFNGEPYLAIGIPPYPPTLAEQGIKVDKLHAPRFGIVENPDEVGRVIKETGLGPVV